MHRIDGTAAKYEVINWGLTGTLERGLLAKGRNFFEPALKSWSQTPE